jgi:nitrite reductase (NADH) small subunit
MSSDSPSDITCDHGGCGEAVSDVEAASDVETGTDTATDGGTTVTDPDDEAFDREAFTKVATVDEIAAGEGEGYTVKGIEIAVFNLDGDFYAISNRCAHQRAPLHKAGDRKINAEDTWTEKRGGVNVEDCTVSCPWHLWEWDLESGVHEASGKRIGTFDCVVDGEDVLVRI